MTNDETRQMMSLMQEAAEKVSIIEERKFEGADVELRFCYSDAAWYASCGGHTGCSRDNAKSAIMALVSFVSDTARASDVRYRHARYGSSP